MKNTAFNVRFGKIAALAPQKRQCEFGSYYPSGTLVKPLPRQAAGTLQASLRTVSATTRKKGETESRKWRYHCKLKIYVSKSQKNKD